MLGEVLPYLEISKKEEKQKKTVEMPNVTGITVKEAKKILKENGLECTVETENDEDTVTDQLPKKGIQVTEGTKVVLYTN